MEFAIFVDPKATSSTALLISPFAANVCSLVLLNLLLCSDIALLVSRICSTIPPNDLVISCTLVAIKPISSFVILIPEKSACIFPPATSSRILLSFTSGFTNFSASAYATKLDTTIITRSTITAPLVVLFTPAKASSSSALITTIL